MTTSSSDLTFADLPDELSEVILSFLSAKELLVAGQVNKRFRAFSLRQEPWEIACREINIWPPVLEDSVAAKKGRRRKMTKYRQAVNDFAVTMQQQPQFRDLYFFHLSQRREERENSLRYAYYERLANRLSLTTTIVAAIAGIGLLVFVVLVPIKYDGYLSVPWTQVFIPLWIGFGWAQLSAINIVCVGWAHSRKAEFETRRYHNHSWFPFISVLICILGTVAVALLVLFTVFYAQRLDGDVSRSWPVIWSPFWVLVTIPAGAGLVACVYSFLDQSIRVKLVMLPSFSSIAAVYMYTYFVAFKLDGMQWYWWQVHLPLFVAGVLWIPCLLMLTVGTATGRGPTWNFVPAAITLAVIFAYITIILESLIADGYLNVTNIGVFVPLWLVTLGAACALWLPVVV